MLILEMSVNSFKFQKVFKNLKNNTLDKVRIYCCAPKYNCL